MQKLNIPAVPSIIAEYMSDYRIQLVEEYEKAKRDFGKFLDKGIDDKVKEEKLSNKIKFYKEMIYHFIPTVKPPNAAVQRSEDIPDAYLAYLLLDEECLPQNIFNFLMNEGWTESVIREKFSAWAAMKLINQKIISTDNYKANYHISVNPYMEEQVAHIAMGVTSNETTNLLEGIAAKQRQQRQYAQALQNLNKNLKQKHDNKS